jgi:hypothetical protein
MSIRVVEYQPPQPVAKPRQALAQSARDSLALGRSVGARLQARDYAGAVEDSIGSTVAAVEALPRPEQSPAMLGSLEAHRITQTELADPTKPPADWQEREANLLPERLAPLAPPPGVPGIGALGPNADFWDDHGAYSETASYFGTFTAGFGDDTREASELARAAVARVGDPVAQAAHAEREELAQNGMHLAAASKRNQARPELIEQARRAMGLAVPSARPGKGSYPEAPDNPAEAAYGTGNESFVNKGMKAYLGSAEARPQELADDFVRTAGLDRPEEALSDFDQRALQDPAAGRANAQLIAAANKSPIVALGADPRNTFYSKGSVKVGKQTAYGITSGGKMLVDSGSPSTAAHESIHNGVERLMKDPKLPARFKKQLENHDQQEFITRALMIDAFGEVESEHDMAQGGKGVHPQIIRAREMLADPKWQAWIGDFKAYAARKIARDRPGGPR